jgi:hypothetical protein
MLRPHGHRGERVETPVRLLASRRGPTLVDHRARHRARTLDEGFVPRGIGDRRLRKCPLSGRVELTKLNVCRPARRSEELNLLFGGSQFISVATERYQELESLM